MKTVDLNADLGEGFSFDDGLIDVVSSASVCCGEHAGSRDLTQWTVTLCQRKGVSAGAHPGVPDRATMGRGAVVVEDCLRRSITSQVQFMVGLGAKYIKLHGSLYNESTVSGPVASMVVEALSSFELPFVGLPGTYHENIAKQLKSAFVAEGFVDRRYTDGGLLVPRSSPGAVLTDVQDMCCQARKLASQVDSLCLHGDTDNCLVVAKQVRRTLEADGFEVRAWP